MSGLTSADLSIFDRIGRCTTRNAHAPHLTQHTEGITVNTSTISAGRTAQVQTVTLRADARQLSDRLARRTGHALLAWSRRRDEQRSALLGLAERRRNEQAAARLQADEFQRITLMALPLV